MSAPDDGDITVTALYTSAVWRWAGFPAAELLIHPWSVHVFRGVNFILGLARLVDRRLPSLRHGLAQRHHLFDELVRRWGDGRVLEIAAGLSNRGAAFTADPTRSYTELDLPHMVEAKRELLSDSPDGRAVLARGNLRLVPGDAERTDFTELVPGPEPVYVITEGLLMYLNAERQRELWVRIHALLRARPGSEYAFDLVPRVEQPRHGRLGRVLEWLMKRFTKGKTFERDERGREQITAELRAIGFAEVELLDTRALDPAWGAPYPDVPTQMLVWRCR